MKNLAKVLLLSATLLTSISAGDSKPSPEPFILQTIEIDLKNWEWMNIGLTGQFHIGVKYISNGQEVIADYQVISQKGKWYHGVLRSYDLEELDVMH